MLIFMFILGKCTGRSHFYFIFLGRMSEVLFATVYLILLKLSTRLQIVPTKIRPRKKSKWPMTRILKTESSGIKFS